MRAAGLADLESPNDRLKFARLLARGGGEYAAVANALAVQAILDGASDAPTASGAFNRRELPPTIAKVKKPRAV